MYRAKRLPPSGLRRSEENVTGEGNVYNLYDHFYNLCTYRSQREASVTKKRMMHYVPSPLLL